MRKLLLLLGISCLLFSCGNINTADLSAYPKLNTITRKLDTEYRMFSDSTFYLTLAKKPGGWFVVKMSRKNYKPISEALYWSSENKTYSKIPRDFFIASSVDTKYSMASAVRNEYAYDHSVYFGYENWEDDAIGVLEKANNLNDTLLEALARAYAAKCVFVSRPEKSAVTNRSKKLNDEQVKEFCRYGDKDIETYKKLLEVNPDYETIIGKVQTKLSNEYMFLWSELKQSGRSEADQYLIAGLYDELMLNFAKNMLNSAEQNAIVFTNGDNDTYPLWYAQEKLGVRKDVAVMNTSLMSIPNWVYTDKAKYKFDLNLPEEIYYDSLADIIYLKNTAIETTDMETVRKGFLEKSPDFQYQSLPGAAPFIPYSVIRLAYSADSLAPVFRTDASYIFKNDLFLLDIIASNSAKRPVYFAQTGIYGTITDGLKASLLCEGLLLRVVYGKNNGKQALGNYYNLDRFYQNFCVNHTYNSEKLKSLQVEPIALNYAYGFHNLANAFLENGDTLQAIKTTEACVAKMPLKLFSDPAAAYLAGDDFCRAGKNEEGRKLYALSIEKIRAALLDPRKDDELQRNNSILEQIISTSEAKGFTAVKDDALSLQKKLAKKMANQ